jgi:hypothetical protein
MFVRGGVVGLAFVGQAKILAGYMKMGLVEVVVGGVECGIIAVPASLTIL